MRVIVTGSRNYDRAARVHAVLSKIGVTILCQGGQTGADRLAKDWALERGIPVVTFEANWDKFGRAAGPIRNAEMIQEFGADLVVAFPGKIGTADCVSKAKKAGIPVLEVTDD